MVTIKDPVETELVIRKSRFLGLACRVDSEADAQRVLGQRRRQHYGARHHCFAFVLGNGAMRYSDDGEPQGTAGVPMLEALKKSGLADALVVCTRYFGGTLLGAGGLARAYTRSAADTLDAAQRVRIVACEVFRCDFDFAAWARAEKALRSAGFEAGGVQYAASVSAEYCIGAGEEPEFLQAVANITQGKTSPVPLGSRLTEIDI
jgi:Uncharacterized conserved protein